MTTDKLYALSEDDVNALRDVIAAHRAGNLGGARGVVRRVFGRSNCIFGVADGTIAGTTGAATQPAGGTVSVHKFVTSGTSDTGKNETAYNLSSVEVTTGMYVVLVRDYQSGVWLTCPTSTDAVVPNHTCANCSSPGAANAPEFWTMVISGMANNGCGTCATYDGTYVIPVFGLGCLWTVSAGDNCRSGDTAEVEAVTVAGNYWVQGKLKLTGTEFYVWAQTASGTRPDCLLFEDESLPYDAAKSSFTVNDCDPTSATCVVSSGDQT